MSRAFSKDPQLQGLSINAKSVLREPQHERYRNHQIQSDKHFSARPEEPPSFGGVSKGGFGENRQSLQVEMTRAWSNDETRPERRAASRVETERASLRSQLMAEADSPG